MQTSVNFGRFNHDLRDLPVSLANVRVRGIQVGTRVDLWSVHDAR